ncbi:MAG TPA: cation diffusion facilitator family transporter [Terracidiphilus sp.]|nr:cation diffusion facilitator family transporter [Terracidiphilus sp.]
MTSSPTPDSHDKRRQQHREAQFAMRLSLLVGVLMLTGKMTAYLLTGSSAIFSDAAESVVHVVVVTFALFSLWLSTRPAVPQFRYGFERITFFSAGFEGAMIVLAAGSILYTTTQKWRHGLTLDHLGSGVLLLVVAGGLNAGLGWYLLRVGKRNHSLILEADGKHVLTDSYTSFGVVAGLGLVMTTGWKPFDPLIAYAVAANILWTGGRLLWRAMKGLLDYSDPIVGHQIRARLDALCAELGLEYHGVRFRATGQRQMIEVHLLFPDSMRLGTAHRLATMVEERLAEDLEMPAEVITHLESLEDHSEVHHMEHYTGRPD